MRTKSTTRTTTKDLCLASWDEDLEVPLWHAFQDRGLQEVLPVPVPYTLESAGTFVTEVAPGFFTEGGANFALLEGGELAGGTSLRRVDPVGWVGRLGYWVAAPHRGRGVAGRAVELMKEWAVSNRFHELELTVAADNLASLRVAERCGFHVVQHIPDHTFANGTTLPTLRLRHELRP